MKLKYKKERYRSTRLFEKRPKLNTLKVSENLKKKDKKPELGVVVVSFVFGVCVW